MVGAERDAVVGTGRVVLLAAALFFVSCVSVVWERDRWHRPLPQEAVDSLDGGDVHLATCLETLGAPLHVWQVADGYALSWAWYDAEEVSYRLQFPLTQTFNASLDYSTIDRNTQGLMLLFDDSDRLVLVKEGFLRDLMAEDEVRSPALPLKSGGGA